MISIWRKIYRQAGVFPKRGSGRATQKEAAIQAVEAVGLNRLKEPGKDLFAKLPQYYDMFAERLGVLRDAERRIY